jgi:hypothetical protein
METTTRLDGPIRALVLLVVLLACAPPGSTQVTQPSGTTVPAARAPHPCWRTPSVTLQGQTILVNGVPLAAAPGVVFAPVPFCAQPGNAALGNPAIYEGLLDRAQALGARVLRVPHMDRQAHEFLCAADRRGLLVTAGFWMDSSPSVNYADSAFRMGVLADFQQFVLALRGQPAVLLYELGNELNLAFEVQGRLQQQLPHAMSLIDEMAGWAHLLDPQHLTATVFGEVGHLGSAQLGTDDASITNLDVLGVNTFRGIHVRDLLEQYFHPQAPISGKALWLSEWGYDTWDHWPTPQGVDEAQAAGALATLWGEIAYDGRAACATVLELTQSAWKVGDGCTVAPGGWLNGCSAWRADEEYFGLLRGDPAWPAALVPTLGYDALQQLWTAPEPIGTITGVGATISLPANGGTVACEDFVVASVSANAADPEAALFVLVQPTPGSVFWPQAAPHRLLRSQAEVSLHAWFGGAPGQTFDLRLVLAPDAVTVAALLQGGVNGMQSLPAGVLTIPGFVQVTRQ